MFRSKSWFGNVFWKPKNPHSLEYLKYLYNVLSKNQIVSENNRSLLVETLRSIAEILIWGDQNDSSVFDFFLEKNMLSFFLKIMKQKCGSYVCVQLLQTLNILFENIRDETSLYYLLSNNHVNSIIVHKFDFSDEEVMAYYISFLKTLSLKLNAHTVHFFYNEHTNDFPLYTEAIKFFNHPESMVRIAVRTLTLNVYRVEDESMLQFIRDKTAAPYFSNLACFIGNHIVELNSSLPTNDDHHNHNRLSDLVAEHLDHLHYLNDILSLDISDLNRVLTDHLLNKLLIPLHIYSLTKRTSSPLIHESKRRIRTIVSLFLLSQVFLIVSHSPLVQMLTTIILFGNDILFLKAHERWLTRIEGNHQNGEEDATIESNLLFKQENSEPEVAFQCKPMETISSDAVSNITDEEKEKLLALDETVANLNSQSLANHPFLEAIVNGLQCNENDYSALFALCLLNAMCHNSGVSRETLCKILLPAENNEATHKSLHATFIERLIRIINSSCQADSKIRICTLELCLKLLMQMAVANNRTILSDAQLAAIVGAKEESTSVLRGYYKSEEIFLDMFEDEYNEMKKKPLNVEFLLMDSNILLPPTGTPMTGIELRKRLPSGGIERARRAIRVFFLIRELCLSLGIEKDNHILPLTNPKSCIPIDHALDLNNSDLVACTVVLKEGGKLHRFLVIDGTQFILVEPDVKKLGWGVAKFVGFLQDIEVIVDKEDSKCLDITVRSAVSRIPLLSAKFIFDDHIRCLAAKQALTKGRMKARQKKMRSIERLLDMPLSSSPTVYNSIRSRDGSETRISGRESRSLFFTHQRVPGFAAALRRDNAPGKTVSYSDIQDRIITRATASSISIEGKPGHSRSRESSISKVNANTGARSRDPSSGSRSHSRHRESGSSPRRSGSPRMPRPRSEEIPLEDMKLKQRRENILLSNASHGKFQTPPLTPPVPTLPNQPAVVVPVEMAVTPSVENRIETSFTQQEVESAAGESGPSLAEDRPQANIKGTNLQNSYSTGNKTPRRKGQVETV
ncbi:hypothetical protein RUM43_004900 [Polyplax serrata]|uniref:Protein CLEC16A homolog n=1 Tax=Polyplax serrata TaxID=468196 RepID=A0AAN8SBD5_POLSC